MSPHASRPSSQDSSFRWRGVSGDGMEGRRGNGNGDGDRGGGGIRPSDRVKAALDERLRRGTADDGEEEYEDDDEDDDEARGLMQRHTSAGEGGEHGGGYKRSTDFKNRVLRDMVTDGGMGTGHGGQLPGQWSRKGDDDDANEDEDQGREQNGNGKAAAALSTTQYLARRHNIKGRRKMYLFYYLPFLNWITQYRWEYLQGDLIAALTMASFYIPMSLSYAENLAHVPPINGLYSFVFNPFVYALLGSCPQMVVGPEAPGSLLVGSMVKSSVDRGEREDDDVTAKIAGVVTGMAGAMILVAGLTRLGFLESVLSRPFLRGFISAIGFVIFVDQLIPEMGLNRRIKHAGGASHGSSWEKVEFLASNLDHAHGMTCGIAFGSFAIIMVCRYVELGSHGGGIVVNTSADVIW